MALTQDGLDYFASALREGITDGLTNPVYVDVFEGSSAISNGPLQITPSISASQVRIVTSDEELTIPNDSPTEYTAETVRVMIDDGAGSPGGTLFTLGMSPTVNYTYGGKVVVQDLDVTLS